MAWDAEMAGMMPLPSGRLVRGRPLRQQVAADAVADLSVFLLARRPLAVAGEFRWVRWPDFRLPADPDDATTVLRGAWQRAAAERVELVCTGGRGRTGTALACIAVLDGVPAAEAVGFVRRHYHPRAVETRGQRRFVARFAV